MNNKNKLSTIIWAILLSISAAALTWMALDSWMYANPDPKPMQVTDKYEAKGKCYIQTWIEVTPEEYIGLDIGDEKNEPEESGFGAIYECPYCKYEVEFEPTNYCPNCGAKMRLE